MPIIRTPPCECGHGGAVHEQHARAPGCISCDCAGYVDANPYAEQVRARHRAGKSASPLVIDANTGERMYADGFFTNVNGEVFVCWLEVGLLSGHALIRRNLNSALHEVRIDVPGYGPATTVRKLGRRPANLGPVERVPLVVRYTHPGFFGQRVAIYPS